jgi:hypothetical protein
MIKDIEEKDGRVELDLTGPDGNAFALLGYAKNFAKQLEYPKEKTNKLLEEMTSGDYENLVAIFDEHFGSFVTLYR